ncbi:hypothetical protein CSUI_006417 [Cystoisospora suis]|uniref:Uncharacterized protein n=1 Tax=Cystoisospora suis TaxID=483139 RepID=A0A2C6KU84_9APIC|nr:hypothetical protein CSUI_006417 [Cystoisospora suis]
MWGYDPSRCAGKALWRRGHDRPWPTVSLLGVWRLAGCTRHRLLRRWELRREPSVSAAVSPAKQRAAMTYRTDPVIIGRKARLFQGTKQ